MTDKELMSRREFMGALAAAAALPSKAFAPEQPPPDKKTPPDTVTGILATTRFTDQHGKAFDPKTVLGGRPYLLAFGYGGCPVCQDITKSLAAAQEALFKDGQEIPIVVVSIDPEKDKDNLKNYTGGYYQVGVRQSAEEKLPEDAGKRREMGEKTHDAFKEAEEKAKKELNAAEYETFLRDAQRRRLLHILCTPSNKEPPELQKKLGRPVNPKDPKYHTPMIIVCDGNGRQVMAGFGAIETDNDKRRRKLAEEIVNAVSAMGRSR